MDNHVSTGDINLSTSNNKRASLKKFRAILLAALVLLIIAPAASFSIQNSSQEIFESNDTLNFSYRTTEKSNYSLNITSAENELARKNLNVTENLTEGNDTDLIYTVSHEVITSPAGKRTVYLWENTTENISNESTRVMNPLDNLSYRVAIDQPEIIEIDLTPSIKFVGSPVTAEVQVADSEENVNVTDFAVDGETVQVNETTSEENLQIFESNFTFNKTQNYNFSAYVEDSSGYTDSSSESFYIEDNPESGSTNVSVTTDTKCLNITSMLSAPGREPTNVITRNTTGSFLGEFINKGSIDHDLSVNLDVTFEGNESWEKGEEPGPVVTSFESKDFTLNASGNGEYFRQFVAVYDAGNYTGRMDVESQCEDPDGNSGLNLDFNVTDNFEIVNVEGEDSLLENGSQTTNQTIPADSSRRGAESDQTLEGDNPEPGSTVQPEPRPEPTLSINMETQMPEYSSAKNRFQEVSLGIENFHNRSVQNVNLVPRVNDLEGDWDTRSATLASVAPGQDLNASVFLSPSENVPAGDYRIPVMAQLTTGRALDVEYINFRVTEQIFRPNLSIKEVPRLINLERNSSSTIPLLVENTGSQALTNISLEVQNIDDCGSITSEQVDELAPNSSANIQLELEAGKQITECQTLFVASSDEGAYSFADVRVEVNPVEGFIPSEFRVPLIASVWTIMLLLYALLTRRYDLDSLTVKLPFLLLIIGETVIFLYLAANYYGVLPQNFLPF